jgi:hypothetical protein
MMILHVLTHSVSRTIEVDTTTAFISSNRCYEHDNGNPIGEQQSRMQVEPKERKDDPDEESAQGHYEVKSGIGAGLGLEILGETP